MKFPRETGDRSAMVSRSPVTGLFIALVVSVLMVMGVLVAACSDSDVTTTTVGSTENTATTSENGGTTTSADTTTTADSETTTTAGTSTTAASGSATTAGATGTTAGASAVEVLIKNFAFDPDPVTVKVGGRVTWTNRDSAFHRLVGDKEEFDSGDMPAAGTFTFTFRTAGTITYHCSLHPTMIGRIVVR